MHSVKQLRLLLVMVAAAVMVACANMGRPEGGPRDELPPVYVRSNPAMGQLNFNGNKITVDFDENIQLDDAMNKIVVSPAQRNTPAISSNGRRVTIELRDTIMPNTTYTIDFADAVKDLNEGNVLDGFAMDFATGDTIDTLRISGMVFEARTLEPAQGMLVGVYSNTSDTAISTLPFERITKTNQLGQFTLRNLKAGSYRVYALNDINRDYHWDRSEDVAFYDVTISPTSEPTVVTDTLTRSTGERDSLVTRNATRFLPDDLLLTWFNEVYTSQYLKDYKRPERNKITFQFGAKSDTLPILRLLNTHRAGDEISTWSTLDASPTLDTLTYWITPPGLVAVDSLRIATTYLRTDSAQNLTEATDTLRFYTQRPKAVKKKEKKKKNEEETDTLPPVIPPLGLRMVTSSTQEVYMPLLMEFDTPITRLDTAAFHLDMKVDTVWTPITSGWKPERSDTLNPRLFRISYPWEYATEYRLMIDTLAATGIYGLHTNPTEHKFKTKSEEDYCALTFNITNFTDTVPAFVELVNGSDAVVRREPVVNGSVTFRYLAPGKYYARIFEDNNGNGIYDTGDYTEGRQPDVAYYYPKLINLKKNWEKSESWNVFETAVDMMKPEAIKKNKPAADKRNRNKKNEKNNEEEEDEDYFDPTRNPFDPNDKGRRRSY